MKIAPTQRLEVLWFVELHKGGETMLQIRNIPEDVAKPFLELMKIKGYEFLGQGSSSLEHVA